MSVHCFAVTGAQGTGKSTLARDLTKACQEQFGQTVILLEGIGSAVQCQGLPLGGQASMDTLFAFVTHHFRRERSCARYARIILQDRCMLDLYAYARLVRSADRFLLEMLAELTLTSLARLDATFYTSMIPDLSKSCSPNETTEFRTAIDHEILAAASDLEIQLIRLEGGREKRTAAAVEEVRRRVGVPQGC